MQPRDSCMPWTNVSTPADRCRLRLGQKAAPASLALGTGGRPSREAGTHTHSRYPLTEAGRGTARRAGLNRGVSGGSGESAERLGVCWVLPEVTHITGSMVKETRMELKALSPAFSSLSSCSILMKLLASRAVFSSHVTGCGLSLISDIK